MTCSNNNSRFSVGDLVRIHGLVSKPQFNQMIGVVKAYHENMERYEIQPSRGSSSLAIKPINLSDDEFLKPTDDKFKTERAFQSVFLWPSPKTSTNNPIQCFSDFPPVDNPSEQDAYVQKELGWKSVDTLSGIEEEGRGKPTFLLLFDGLDESSPKNHAAMKIARLLPPYERKKCSRYRGIIRGVVVLVYSPMKSTFFTSGLGLDHLNNLQVVEANQNRRFTHKLLNDIIEFHKTDRADQQYEKHDNPMHRGFGGIAQMMI
jgi:hypothetical protein